MTSYEGNGYTLADKAANGAKVKDLLGVVNNAENTSLLQGADLITITIGGNDLMNLLYERTTTLYNTATGKNEPVLGVMGLLMSGDINAMVCAKNAIKELSMETADGTAFPAMLRGFESDLKDVIIKIRSLTSTAKVLISTQYNPYRWLTHDLIRDIIPDMEKVIELFNQVIRQNTSSGYFVLESHGKFNAWDSVNLTNPSIFSCLFKVNFCNITSRSY